MGDKFASNLLIYEGCNFFRQRVLLSTLSGRSIKILKLRFKENDPGVKDFEVNLMKLIEKISKGASIKFSESATTMIYHPGMLDGGKIEHECSVERPISYYLEFLAILAPFMKHALEVKLTGVTNMKEEPSIDVLIYSMLPILKKFLGTDEGLEIKINKRGSAPDGGGEVFFQCPNRQKLRPIQFVDPGKIKRIRGVSWATRVSPQDCRRLTDSSKEIISDLIHDIFITSDHRKGVTSGKSPGFGLTLVAESTNGVFYCGEHQSSARGSSEGPSLPEDVGKQAAINLLIEVSKGGCVSSDFQSMACILMVLGDKDVSRLEMGPLNNYTVNCLRHIRDFFGVIFKIDVTERNLNDKKTETCLLTCTGVGFKNLSKPIL